MSSSNENRINFLSRQLRSSAIKLPPAARRVVGSYQNINAAAEEWTFGILGKLVAKEKIKMKTIRAAVNSLWRQYRGKEICVLGHNLMLVRLNNEEEQNEVIQNGPWIVGGALFVVQKYFSHIPLHDYEFTHQIFTIQFKHLKLEHMNVAIIDKALEFMGKKILTSPPNCIPKYGNTVTTRIEIDLKKPLHRGGWWKTIDGGEAWVRYHWSLQLSNICDKCWVIDHVDIKCMQTNYLLHLDILSTEECEAYMNEEADVYEENEDERSMDNSFAQEMAAEAENSRQNKRMRNSTMNHPPSMNPHNLHVTPPSSRGNHISTTLENHNAEMMEADISNAASNPTTENHGAPAQVYTIYHPFASSLNCFQSYFFNSSYRTIILALSFFVDKMKIISWNCNGFGGKETRNYLIYLNKMLNPDIIFLQETKVNSDKILNFIMPLNFPNNCFVPSVGRARGICLLWKDGFQFDIIYQDKNMFHCLVCSDLAKPKWLLSCVYGSPYPQEKAAQWSFIEKVCETCNIFAPWVLLGDLNITLHSDDRLSGSSTAFKVSPIAQVVHDIGLTDLGFHGNPYTWTSNKHGTGKIETRIRHCPIFLDMSPTDKISTKNWKIFECWLRDISCNTTIKDAWAKHYSGSAAYSLDKKLGETRRIMSIWNRNSFGNIQQQLNNLQQQLLLLQQPNAATDNTAKILEVEKEINEWHIREEEFYKQKSRDSMFTEVDQNTKYFHLQANKRRARNRIESLQKPNGTWCSGRQNLEKLLINHFTNIMTTFETTRDEDILNILPTCIKYEDNMALVKIPDVAEIECALKSMKC
ncbi:uncharacterized protein LOC113359485 [Papaver somniferum]|uniref:uncharacterized protein LOC113359485 n=1 Tax=Papaver somniferum TaxID=3469 RepID=UPI000E6F569D|nr:uncharacterized protein LOC113359485 [Papaver somniferum]